jgi:outer membrane protein TolC
MKLIGIVLILLVSLSLSAFAQERAETLSLDEAVKIALENNPDLKASSASVDITKAKVRGAESSYYPQVQFRFILPFVERESGIFADQLIWDFWRTPNLVKASKANLKSSEFDKEVTREDVILNTKVAYYTALAQRRIVEAMEKTVAQNEKILERTEGFFKAGRVSKIDVTKARVNLGNAKLNLITAENNLEMAKINLAKVMGIKGDFNYELEDMLEYKGVDVNLDNIISKAIELNPQVKSLRAKEVASKAELSASKDAFYPMVIGRAAYRFAGAGATGPDFIAGVGIRFFLFQGFSRLSEVNESRARLEHAEAEIESMEGEITSEVKQLYMNLKFAEESVEVTKTSEMSAEENSQLAQEKYRLGTGSAVELSEAQALLASTSANHIEAIYNYKIAVARLERAIGEKIE